MTGKSIIVAGLPGSGKTTLLAALWHLLHERGGAHLSLKLTKLGKGDYGHLNRIASLWRDAKQQSRTAIAGNQIVTMNLADSSGSEVTVEFPDTAGEAFAGMWEDREVAPELASILRSGNVTLLVNTDTVREPRWLIDERAQLQKMGLPVPPPGQKVIWRPDFAPTQVPLVELLQFLQESPLDAGPRKLAVMLSVWDKGREEGRTPTEFLAEKLPLLSQYLASNSDLWDVRVYGLSAQGGEYDDPEKPAEKSVRAKELREMDKPSARIELVLGDVAGHDLSEPFMWLMQ